MKEFVGENLAAEIITLKSVTSLLVKTRMTDAFSNDVSQSSTRTQSIDDGDEIEDAGDKSEKSVVQYSKMNWSAVYRMTDKLPVMYLYLGLDNDLHSTSSPLLKGTKDHFNEYDYAITTNRIFSSVHFLNPDSWSDQ